MKIYQFKKTQLLKITLDEAWEFFSNPNNLDKITPDFMKFKIISNPSDKMYSGQIITYRIGLMPGVNQTWVTEIKNVDERKSFIDEQRFGPYKFWHHLHMFDETEEGVMTTDLIHYAVPFGIFGRAVHAIYIKRTLEEIFSFRHNFLEKHFAK